MAIIVLIKNELEELKVTLSQTPVIIGRSSSCKVRVNDSQMSSKHIAIKISSTTRVLVKDLGTTNGTYLNESIITDTNLMLDDVIRIGDTSLTILHEPLTSQEVSKLTKSDGLTKVRYMSLKTPDDERKILKPSEVIKQKELLEKQKKSEKAEKEKLTKDNNNQNLKLAITKKNVRHSKSIKKIKKKISLLTKIINFFRRNN